jgi:hypothetical protein
VNDASTTKPWLLSLSHMKTSVAAQASFLSPIPSGAQGPSCCTVAPLC